MLNYSPWSKEKQFELFWNADFNFTQSELNVAVDKYLAGDRHRLAELFDITPEEFIGWASGIKNIQDHGIYSGWGTQDGIYIVPGGSFLSQFGNPSEWEVYEQERGSSDNKVKFKDLNSAKYYAMSICIKYRTGFNPLGSNSPVPKEPSAVQPVKTGDRIPMKYVQPIIYLFIGLIGFWLIARFNSTKQIYDISIGIGLIIVAGYAFFKTASR